MAEWFTAWRRTLPGRVFGVDSSTTRALAAALPRPFLTSDDRERVLIASVAGPDEPGFDAMMEWCIRRGGLDGVAVAAAHGDHLTAGQVVRVANHPAVMSALRDRAPVPVAVLQFLARLEHAPHSHVTHPGTTAGMLWDVVDRSSDTGRTRTAAAILLDVGGESAYARLIGDGRESVMEAVAAVTGDVNVWVDLAGRGGVATVAAGGNPHAAVFMRQLGHGAICGHSSVEFRSLCARLASGTCLTWRDRSGGVGVPWGRVGHLVQAYREDTVDSDLVDCLVRDASVCERVGWDGPYFDRVFRSGNVGAPVGGVPVEAQDGGVR